MVPRPNWQSFTGKGEPGCIARPSVGCVRTDAIKEKRVKAATRPEDLRDCRARRFLASSLMCRKEEVHQLPKPTTSRIRRSASSPACKPSALKLNTAPMSRKTTSSPVIQSATSWQRVQRSNPAKPQPKQHTTEEGGTVRSQARNSRPSSAPASRDRFQRRMSDCGTERKDDEKEKRATAFASLQPTQRRRSSITTLLKNQFYDRQEARQREKLAEIELANFNKSVKKLLDRLSGTNSRHQHSPASSRSTGSAGSSQSAASASSSGMSSCSSLYAHKGDDDAERKSADEEELVTALRRHDLDAGLRLGAILCLARILAAHANEGGAKNKIEIAELGDTILQEEESILNEPWTALELAELCEQSLSLCQIADMLYEKLEQEVLRGGRLDCTYMLLDLAERHHRQGRDAAARALFDHACDKPLHMRDPRCRSRFYEWRFNEECDVPDDAHRVKIADSIADKALKFMRPVGGLQAGCTCSLGVARQAPSCKLHQWRHDVAHWKISAWERDCEACVTKAEKLAAKIADVASCFADDAKLIDLSSHDLRKAIQDTAKAAKVATVELAEARKCITLKQIEAKGKDSSDAIDKSIIEFHMRLSKAETEVGEYMTTSALVGKRLEVRASGHAANKNIEDANFKLVKVEEKVEDACLLIAELQDLDSVWNLAERVKEASRRSCKAAMEIKELENFLLSQAGHCGISEHERMRYAAKTNQAHRKMEECNVKLREISETTDVRIMMAECEKRVTEVEGACSRVQAAESDLDLHGDFDPEEQILCSLVREAQLAAHDAHTFMAMKHLGAKRLVAVSPKIAIEGLSQLESRLEIAVGHLQMAKKRMNQRQVMQPQVKRQVAITAVDAVKKAQACFMGRSAFSGRANEIVVDAVRRMQLIVEEPTIGNSAVSGMQELRAG